MSKHLLLNLILTINPINGNKEKFNIHISDTKLKKEFESERKFYKKLLTEYLKAFEYKEFISLEEEKIRVKFIKEFFKKNKKTLDKIEITILIILLLNINNKNKEIIIDMENNLIKEVEYKDIKKLNEVYVQANSSILVYSSFILKNKITEEELKKIEKEIQLIFTKEKSKFETITKSINFKDLIGNKKAPKIKDKKDFEKPLKEFIKSNDFSPEEVKNITNKYLGLCAITNELYLTYFKYLNSEPENFEKDVEIIEKIINYKDSNKYLNDVTYNDIYFALKGLSNKKIKTNKDELSIYTFFDFNQYLSYTTTFTDYKKYMLINFSLNKIIELLDKNQMKIMKYRSSIIVIITPLQQKVFGKSEIKNIE